MYIQSCIVRVEHALHSCELSGFLGFSLYSVTILVPPLNTELYIAPWCRAGGDEDGKVQGAKIVQRDT